MDLMTTEKWLDGYPALRFEAPQSRPSNQRRTRFQSKPAAGPTPGCWPFVMTHRCPLWAKSSNTLPPAYIIPRHSWRRSKEDENPLDHHENGQRNGDPNKHVKRVCETFYTIDW